MKVAPTIYAGHDGATSDAYAWCSPGENDGDGEGEGEGVGEIDRAAEAALRREEEEAVVGVYVGRGCSRYADRRKERILSFLSNQRRILSEIYAGSGLALNGRDDDGNNNTGRGGRRNEGTGEGNDGEDDDKIGGGGGAVAGAAPSGKEIQLDLLRDALLALVLVRRRGRGDDDGEDERRRHAALYRLVHYKMSFAYDLVGCLRRHILQKRGRRDSPPTTTSYASPLPTLRAVRLNSRFLRWFGDFRIRRETAESAPGRGDPDGGRLVLRRMLVNCIADLPDLERFHMAGDTPVAPCRTLAPVLRPVRQSESHRGGRRRRRGPPHHLKELLLRNLEFDGPDEMIEFANWIGGGPRRHPHHHYENLRRLEISVLHPQSICLDPIVRAVGGGGALPRLETFRLVQRTQSKFYLGEDDDGDDNTALVSLLNKPSIKHLTLTGFMKPKHIRLMGIHLSGHPNIETVQLWALDLFDNAETSSSSATTQRQEEGEGGNEVVTVAQAMRCLVQMVRSNANIRHVILGNTFFAQWFEERVQRCLRDISIGTCLNRNGLKHFLGCSSSNSSSSSNSWTRRECVDFLSRLGINDVANSTDAMTLEATFLAMRMRPDLCQRTGGTYQ